MRLIRPIESDETTKTRLVEAAGEVFGERGFRDATVREICARASANVAAVNYHFGDKASLYRATLLRAHRAGVEMFPPLGDTPPDAPAEERLRGFVSAFVRRLLSPERPAWHARLMSREMAEPTGLIDTLVREAILPLYGMLSGIVAEIVPPGTDPAAIRLSAQSIVGQCVFHRVCAPVADALAAIVDAPRPSHERIADHIWRFSLAALTNAKTLLVPDRGAGELDPQSPTVHETVSDEYRKASGASPGFASGTVSTDPGGRP